MKDLCKEWNNPAYQEDSEDYSSEISKKIREYNEAFFEEKALIICSGLGIRPSDTLQVRNIKVDETQLLLTVHRIVKDGKDLGMFWLFLIEVKKTDIVGVTTVQINEK